MLDLVGSSRSATTGRAEASSSATEPGHLRQALLGSCSARLVRLEAVPHHRQAGNGGPLAPSWFSFVSEVDFQSQEEGREKTGLEGVRYLIFRMVAENPTWGALRIHGELLMLSFEISERTVSRWMKRAPRDPQLAKRWLAFLRNHREAIAAMDFFTVPIITFGALYCFFIIGRDRRRILHFNVTKHPTSLWIVQQLRQAFPFELVSRFFIFDRDAKYLEVPVAVRSMGIRPVRTSFESPWQNGVAERWVESCRRDLLDHILAVHESHLQRLLSEYLN